MSEVKRWKPRTLPVAAALFVGNLFLHKPISDLCDAAYARFGFTTYNRAVLILISVGCVSVAAALAWRARRRLVARRPLAAMLLLAAMTVACQRWLLVANIELIHFPQYALLAGLLLAAGLSPQKAWLGSTVAGVADEFYQLAVIYAGRPGVYLDFNDMILNAVGAAWGVLLLAPPCASRTVETRQCHRRAVLAGIFAVLALLIWLDPPGAHPFFRRAATGMPYHVLSAAEGWAATIVIRVVVAVGAPAPPRGLTESAPHS